MPLSNLTSTAGALTPAFNASTLAYTVDMPYTSYETPTRTVTATTTSETITINGVAVASGLACAATFINVGNTVFTIVVAGGATYTLTVVRAAPSAVNTLSALGISVGTLTPSFLPSIYNYTANVAYDGIATIVNAASANANSKIIIEGTTSNSRTVELRVGANNIVITCTAENDISIATYNIAVTRADTQDSVALMNSKTYAIGGPTESSYTQVLKDFALRELTVVSQVQALADCAKNLPYRLMELAIRKAEQLILDNPLAQDIMAQLSALEALYANIKRISELVNIKLTKEETLAEALFLAKTLTGVDLVDKTNDILNKFGDVVGIGDLINNLQQLNLCEITNYGANGAVRPSPTKIPLGSPPPPVEGVASPVANMTYDSEPKDRYDAFIFQLKEHLVKDPQKVAALTATDLENYIRMLGICNTLAYSYHDNISRTADDAKDAQYKATYLKLVQDELSKHPEWNGDLKVDYNGRTSIIENEITRNTAVIRAYYSRNGAASGDWVPMYMTAYGNAAIDVTTKNEIASGKLQNSDQFNGAYNVALVQGTSVASNYWKGKTVLEIRYAKDQSPVGSGRVTVHDTGGMSNNVIDYYCGDDKALYDSISRAGTNNGGKTKPNYATAIEVRVVSGGPKAGKTV
jgi:hypothetical protein